MLCRCQYCAAIILPEEGDTCSECEVRLAGIAAVVCALSGLVLIFSLMRWS